MLAKLLKITRYYQFTITTYFYSHHSSSCFLFIETCFLLNSINKDNIITTCHAWQIERNIILFNNTFTPFFLFKKMYIPRADIAINTCKLILVLFRFFVSVLENHRVHHQPVSRNNTMVRTMSEADWKKKVLTPIFK